jgi:hypothetical protein
MGYVEAPRTHKLDHSTIANVPGCQSAFREPDVASARFADPIGASEVTGDRLAVRIYRCLPFSWHTSS